MSPKQTVRTRTPIIALTIFIRRIFLYGQKQTIIITPRPIILSMVFGAVASVLKTGIFHPLPRRFEQLFARGTDCSGDLDFIHQASPLELRDKSIHHFPSPRCAVLHILFHFQKKTALILKYFQQTCSAPALLHAEFGNVALKKVIRKLCGKDHAAAQIRLLLRSGIKIYRCDEILPDAFILVNRMNCTVYDALYCALARVLNAELATLDTRILSACADIGIKCFGINGIV